MSSKNRLSSSSSHFDVIPSVISSVSSELRREEELVPIWIEVVVWDEVGRDGRGV